MCSLPWQALKGTGPGWCSGALLPPSPALLGWPVASSRHSLQETRLVLLLVVGPKLDLALVPGELTGLVEGDGVRAVKDVVSGLEAAEGE